MRLILEASLVGAMLVCLAVGGVSTAYALSETPVPVGNGCSDPANTCQKRGNGAGNGTPATCAVQPGVDEICTTDGSQGGVTSCSCEQWPADSAICYCKAIN